MVLTGSSVEANDLMVIGHGKLECLATRLLAPRQDLFGRVHVEIRDDIVSVTWGGEESTLSIRLGGNKW